MFRLAIHSKCALVLSSGLSARPDSWLLLLVPAGSTLYFATAPGYREMNSGRNEGDINSDRADCENRRDPIMAVVERRRIHPARRQRRQYTLLEHCQQGNGTCSIYSKGSTFLFLSHSRPVSADRPAASSSSLDCIITVLFHLSLLFSCLLFGFALVIFHHPLCCTYSSRVCPHGIDHPCLLSITNYKREPGHPAANNCQSYSPYTIEPRTFTVDCQCAHSYVNLRALHYRK